MQTERPVYKEIEELLEGVELPRMALVEKIDTPATLADIREGVREALRQVEFPSGSVAIGVGSRGVGGIGEVVAALVGSLKEVGAEPFVVPVIGGHGPRMPRGRHRCWSTWVWARERSGAL